MIVYRSPKGMLHAVAGKAVEGMLEKCAKDGRWREVPGECRGGYPVVLDKIVMADDIGNVFIGDSDDKSMPLDKYDANMRRAVREFLVEAGV